MTNFESVPTTAMLDVLIGGGTCKNDSKNRVREVLQGL